MLEFATLLLAVLPPPQGNPTQPDVVIATGALVGDELPSSALGLGSGGLVDGKMAAARAQAEVGSHTTRGGVLVRIAPAGVRVDFPTGTGLFVDSRGRVHTRSGAATLPHLHGLDLVFGDGARLVVKTSSSSGRRPLRSVGIEQGDERRMLWQSRRRVRNANHRRDGNLPRSALSYQVVGDGDVLYKTTRRGMLVECERVLCPNAKLAQFPKRRLVIIGDGLIHSLKELPSRMPTKSIEYPDGPLAAMRLAHMADQLFPPGVLTQSRGAADISVVELFGGMRLEVHQRPKNRIVLQLIAPRHERPLAEWVCDHTALLYLVRQDGDREGKGRYFQRGVPVEVIPRRRVPRFNPRIRQKDSPGQR